MADETPPAPPPTVPQAAVVETAHRVESAQVVHVAELVTSARTVRPAWHALTWRDWFEFTFRVTLLALLCWFAVLLNQLAAVRTTENARTTGQHDAIENIAREQTRLLRSICLATTTPYDSARGVCDPSGTAEMKKPPVPKLKGGPYQK